MAAGDREPASGAGKPFLNSSEVVDRLGISKSTLYAYVSRGLIRSEPDPGSPRTRRYRADDVERLLNRQRLRTDPDLATSEALDQGNPVLESDVSVITEERLYYRGHDALELARERTLEAVIALLWFRDFDVELPAPEKGAATARRELLQATKPLARSLDVPARVQMILPALEQREPASYDVRPETTLRIGMDIVQTCIGAMVGADEHSGIARSLQAYWAPGQTDVARLIDAALILSTDHELDVSTFTVRCIASAGAPLHSAIAGGLATLRGRKHGGATLQVEALMREAASSENVYSTLRQRLQRGETLAGFGHRLYPSGDPRGALLMSLLDESGSLSSSPEVSLAREISRVALELQGVQPNLEFGMATLCRAISQPAGTPMALMALGRTVGWIAHAVEEYQRDQLIRPRTRSA